jgi:hypothetical protein
VSDIYTPPEGAQQIAYGSKLGPLSNEKTERGEVERDRKEREREGKGRGERRSE